MSTLPQMTTTSEMLHKVCTLLYSMRKKSVLRLCVAKQFSEHTQKPFNLGTLLASICMSLLLNAVTNIGMQNRPRRSVPRPSVPRQQPQLQPSTSTTTSIQGENGVQNRPYSALISYQPPPFVGTSKKTTG